MTAGHDRRPAPAGSRPGVLSPRARALLPFFLLALVALSVRQLWFSVPERLVLSGPTMGTTWSVVMAAGGRTRDDVAAAREAIDGVLTEVDALMSTWNPDSELSQLNGHHSSEGFALSPATFEVFSLAQRVSEKTGGALDVTVGPLVAAWGFGAGARVPGQGPDAAELRALQARVGYRLLQLDAANTSLRKSRPDVRCDLSAVAKGYAVDEVARVLGALGWSNFLVEIGGELRASGARPDGGPWRVGIERPDADGRVVQGVVELRDQSMATSGDYRNFYEDGGVRLSHIIDPRTGRPVGHAVASVTVLHRDAAVADAWATALTVLGPDPGIALAEAEGLSALFLLRVGSGSFESRATRAFPAVAYERDADPAAQ